MKLFQRLFGYGVGDLGLNVYWNVLSLFLIFWYTDVAGVDPRTAGAIYFAGLFWDAISDPLVASFVQRNRSRWGTYRPFLVGGGVPLALAFLLLFLVPPLDGALKIAGLAFVHILFRSTYTLVAVPYAALSGRITYESTERTLLSGVRMFCAMSGMLLVTAAWYPVSRMAGEGQEVSATGFLGAAAAGALFASFCLAVCFVSTRELPPPGGHRKTDYRLTNFWSILRDSRGLKLLVALKVFQTCGVASLFTTLAFFLDAHAGQLRSQESAMMFFALANLIGVPFWSVVGQRYGRRLAWISGAILMTVTGFQLALAGPWFVAGYPLQLAIMGFSNAAFAVLIWSIIPDMVDYVDWETGRRDEGVVFGVSLFTQKLSGGLAGFAVGMMLTWVGYDGVLANQSAATVRGIEIFLGAATSVMVLLSVSIIPFLPIDRLSHARIVKELKDRV